MPVISRALLRECLRWQVQIVAKVSSDGGVTWGSEQKVAAEKNQKIGGLMRYGIPDFKMEKHAIDRRAEQMAAEGVELRTNCKIW